MVLIYVRASYLCGVISNISQMRNAINSVQLNKSGVITAAGKQMHVLSKRESVFTFSWNEWHEKEYIALSTISKRQRIHGLRNVVCTFSKCNCSVIAAAKNNMKYEA